MCKITVFTAAYNRGHLIERLYRALQRQTNFDFEWLVIDDGSQDNTPQLFEQWVQEENPFPIRFFHQENQGLIRTLNRGVQMARGEYLAKIDSDDFVVDDYMEKALSWLSAIEGNEEIYGVSGLRVQENGEPLSGRYPDIPEDPGYVDATELERKKYHLDTDMSELWRTEVLRQHIFPVWPTEKFAPEQIVFEQIGREGLKIRWYSQPMCNCKYQPGGMTLGSRRLEEQNPMGYAMMYNSKLLLSGSRWSRFLSAMQMTALSIYACHPGYLKNSNSPLATILSFPFGVVLSIRRKIQYSKVR